MRPGSLTFSRLGLGLCIKIYSVHYRQTAFSKYFEPKLCVFRCQVARSHRFQDIFHGNTIQGGFKLMRILLRPQAGGGVTSHSHRDRDFLFIVVLYFGRFGIIQIDDICESHGFLTNYVSNSRFIDDSDV